MLRIINISLPTLKNVLMESITEQEDIKFFRRVINTILNDKHYLSTDRLHLEFHKNRKKIIAAIRKEFVKYNWNEDIISSLIPIFIVIFSVIEKEEGNMQQVKGFSDIAFLKQWRKIALKLKEVVKDKKVVDATPKKII